MAGNGAAALLGMADIVKRFPGVVALAGVDLDVRPGEVHCLLGQNGAGKSTLIKVLAGVHEPDEGTITWEGEEVHLGHPQAAMDLGIATIYQELDLVEGLTVAENIFLGHESRASGSPSAGPPRVGRGLLERLGHPEISPSARGRHAQCRGPADRQHGPRPVARRAPHRHGRAVRGARRRRGHSGCSTSSAT